MLNLIQHLLETQKHSTVASVRSMRSVRGDRRVQLNVKAGWNSCSGLLFLSVQA